MFLEVFGHTLSVSEREGGRLGKMFSGNRAPSFNGGMVSNQGVAVDDITLTTSLLANTEGQALAAILGEDWHYLPFTTDMWSLDGYGPESGVSSVITTYANITTAIYDMRLVGPWTVMGYFMSDATEEHFVVTSDGTKWFDGVSDDARATTWLSVGSEGQLTFTGESVREVVVFRCVLVASLVSSFFTYQASQDWTRHLKCDGDFRSDLPANGSEFAGAVNSHKAPSTGSTNNMRAVEFTLQEV